MTATERMLRRIGLPVLTALCALTVADRAAGQLARASAATLGTGGNATATARGFAAISVNPAGLAMPGSGFSLAVVPLQLRTGLDPVTLADLSDAEGARLSEATKEAWLEDVNAAGEQAGEAGVELTGVAVTGGNLGFQISTLASGSMTLAPGAVELLLYGNAGRTGSPGDFDLSGSSMDGFAVSTAGLSYAVPLDVSAGETAVGATLKYSVGHVVALARDRGGTVSSDPIRVELDFPMLRTDTDRSSFDNGSGFGLDLGFQMERDRLSLGAAIHNVFHTFSWDTETLLYVPGSALLEQGESETDFDDRPGSEAPAALRGLLDEMTFEPTVAVGAAYDVAEDVTVVADARNRFGDGLDPTPRVHVGAGVEYRALPALQLRGGGAVISGGVQYGGGASLLLGPVNVSAALAARRGDGSDAVLGQLTVSFGDR